MERRLAAIFVADVAGYSRLMSLDEEATLRSLQHCREAVINPTIAGHRGRVVKLMGDGVLVEFASVVDAVTCAVAFQRNVNEHNAKSESDPRLDFRIGVNLGDVIIEGDDIYGDGVNVAARLEAIAEPCGICIARSVFEQIRHRFDIDCRDMGEIKVKNIQDPVHAYSIQPLQAEGGRSGHPRPPRPEDARGSIVVLPFDSLSADNEDRYLAEGIATEIISMLSWVHDLRVISRAGSLSRQEEPPDPWTIVSDLKVHYVLSGNVRRAGDRVRVFAELTAVADRSQLWSRTYDRQLADLFQVQEEIAEAIVVAFGGEFLRAEWRRASKRSTGSLDDWGLVQKTKSLNLPVAGRGAIDEAMDLANRAVAIDPGYAGAHACLASVLMQRMINRHGVDPGQDRVRAQKAIDRAVELAPNDPAVLRTLGNVSTYCGQHEKAVDAFRRAVQLAPFDFHSWGRLGRTLAYCGNPDELQEGQKILDRILAAAPNHPMVPYWLYFKANACAREERYEDAARLARMSVDTQPGYAGAWLTLADALQKLGRFDEATESMERARKANPAIVPDHLINTERGLVEEDARG